MSLGIRSAKYFIFSYQARRPKKLSAPALEQRFTKLWCVGGTLVRRPAGAPQAFLPICHI
ncbi:unnamed protein product [Clavelina lepadiformis]|uniref:Uncharacterized protein n=1 Tax=Clavelina lepadiformis TaxID=159417 RepID=A0ABP0FXM2_CLALP